MITNAIPGTMMDKYFTDLDKARSAIADIMAKHPGTELEVKIDPTRLGLVLDEEYKIVYHVVVKEATRVTREPYYTDKPPTLTC